MKKSFRLLLLFSLSIFLLVSCKDDIDDVLPENRDRLQASEFVYRAMNLFYLYKSQTPELANDYFSNKKDLQDFIADLETPENLFEYLTYEKDQFSALVDDYVELERALQGKNHSTGAIFFSFTYENNFYLLVRNVIPNSSAGKNNVVRGDVFHAINGQSLTQNNVNELLNSPTLKLSYAYETPDGFENSTNTVSLQNQELNEPSIAEYKTINVGGTKVGYLMYNSFIAAYNQELNEVFRYFKGEGVEELVLDLRYNSGGSMYSAELLCSMITGQFKGQVLYENEWNEDLQSYYGEVIEFPEKLSTGEAIESLQLQRVAILTQPRTASASELIINALDPYINVIQVGTPTRGKYQGSVMLYDSPNYGKQHLNPMHRYAMLPLVLKAKNSVGFTDFDEGLNPDIFFQESVNHIKNNLGTVEEPLLKEALLGLGLTVPRARAIQRSEISTKKAIPLQATPSILDGTMYFEREEN